MKYRIKINVDIQPLHILQDDPDDYIGAAKVSILCLKTLDTALKEGTLCLTTEFVICTCTSNILLHNIIGRSCVLCEDWTSLPDSINLFQRLLALQVCMLCVHIGQW